MGENDIWAEPFGIPGIDTTIRLMLKLAAQGVIALPDLVRMLAENPARLYGLYPQKGRLPPGSDGDFILVDPGRKQTIKNRDIVSKCGWSPFDGFETVGLVLETYLRVNLVAKDGKPTGQPGYGHFIPRLGAGQ